MAFFKDVLMNDQDPKLKTSVDNTESTHEPEKNSSSQGNAPEINSQPEAQSDSQEKPKPASRPYVRTERKPYVRQLVREPKAPQEPEQQLKEPAVRETPAPLAPAQSKEIKESREAQTPAPAGSSANTGQPSGQGSYRSYENNNYREQKPRQQHQQQQPIPLEELTMTELNMYARRLGIVGATLLNKAALIERIKYFEAHPDLEIEVQGVLEKLPDGFGFLRSAFYDYVSGPDDVYVSPSQIRRFNLRTGDTIAGVIRKPKEGEKYFALLKVSKVNYEEPALAADRPNFDRLSPLHPNKKFNIEFDPTCISTRIMDLFTPVGKGQRALIVAPPKVGKTMLLKEITQAIIANHPDTFLIILLIDERPEEVAEIKRAVRGSAAEVISSTFDEAADRHIQVAEIVMEKAKRLVEAGKDVVIVLDSITRLSRAYNTMAPASGKILTGGIDANALQRPKRFFGAARNTEEGGSLTIIGSALVETGSRMDEVIYEEFKGTGNMEMHMTRKLSNRRIYPSFDLLMSGTRREDLLLPEDDLNKVWVLQKFLATMNTIEGMEFLIDKMKKSKNNREFLESINKKGPGSNGSSGSGNNS